MARKLTERELRKIERYALSDKKSELIDFFSELPRKIVIPRPVLMGSSAGNDFFVEGYTVTSAIIEEIYFLDDEYTDRPNGERIFKSFEKRRDRIDAALWNAVDQGKRLQLQKTCVASRLGNCSSEIISAHAIQKSELRKLSTKDRHVYGFLFGGKADSRNFQIPERIGIRVATAFTGICKHHDNTLFRPIEAEAFVASDRQLFLFHFRSLLFEHYRRSIKYGKIERMYDKLSETGHARDFTDLQTILEANSVDRVEVESQKKHAEDLLSEGSFSNGFLCCWKSSDPAPIAGSITIGPVKDFQGSRIQHPNRSFEIDWVTLTVTPKDGGTIFVLGSNARTATAARMAESFEKVPAAKKMQVLISYCLCCMEDLILFPHFWESLTTSQHEAMVRTYKARYFPRIMPSLGKWEMNRVLVEEKLRGDN